MLVKNIVAAAVVAGLASCGHPAFAQHACVSTTEAVKMAQDNGVKPTILRGKEMQPFILLANAAGSTGLEHARFIAVIKTDEGAAVFFGNAASVCGPLMISQAQYLALMRPA